MTRYVSINWPCFNDTTSATYYPRRPLDDRIIVCFTIYNVTGFRAETANRRRPASSSKTSTLFTLAFPLPLSQANRIYFRLTSCARTTRHARRQFFSFQSRNIFSVFKYICPSKTKYLGKAKQ